MSEQRYKHPRTGQVHTVHNKAVAAFLKARGYVPDTGKGTEPKPATKQ
ncbi:hypothetical protein [Aeromicrobium phragmitis]|nr:hypothetical protein [Aeromicrobium phragmitis]